MSPRTRTNNLPFLEPLSFVEQTTPKLPLPTQRPRRRQPPLLLPRRPPPPLQLKLPLLKESGERKLGELLVPFPFFAFQLIFFVHDATIVRILERFLDFCPFPTSSSISLPCGSISSSSYFAHSTEEVLLPCFRETGSQFAGTGDCNLF